MKEHYTLLPEWTAQEAVLLVWPDVYTDWLPWLETVQSVYLEIIATLNQAKTSVVLLVRKSAIKSCKEKLSKEASVLLVQADYNDTWIRDYGFLTCSNGEAVKPIEFVFNGWGEKFPANKDNHINQAVLSQLCTLPIRSIELVLEGGAVEINQHGTLLSTALCLSNPKRNGLKSLEEYQQNFASHLGASKSTILQHGYLAGDDTDGHVDTLVRFTPNSGLVIQSAFNRPRDPHFSQLNALVDECVEAFPGHQIFELPLPNVINDEGQRLPASYANYLISNQHILCPIYQQKEDAIAIEKIQHAYPDFKIVPINCLPLVQQFGSLHCISMQVPEGVLKPEVLHSIEHGVYLYE